MRTSWVLDDRGDIWPEASRNLGIALNTQRSGDELTAFLVSQMGFVVIRERGSWTDMQFDPATVSPVALTSIFYWTADRLFRPASVSAWGKTSVAKVFNKKLDLLNHVGGLIEQRTPRPRFERHNVCLEMSPFNSQVRMAVDLCRAPLEMGVKVDLLQSLLSDTFTIFERGDGGDYEVVVPSKAMRAHDLEFCSRDRPSLRAASDRDFGIWSADCLQPIRANCAARAESVNACIAFPGRGPARYTYDRLIVPMSASTGRDALLIASTVRG